MHQVPRPCPISACVILHAYSLTVAVRDHVSELISRPSTVSRCIDLIISSRALNHSVEFKRLQIVWSDFYFIEINV